MRAIQSILVAADGSPPSLAALEHAVALADDENARVEVLYVEGDDDPSLSSVLSPTRSVRQENERALADAVEHAREILGSLITMRIVRGDPLRTIVTVASDGMYDLLVVGTHGRMGRLHALLGSVAEGVVRNAPCPVLTVRELGGGYQSFAERRHGRPSLVEQSDHRH